MKMSNFYSFGEHDKPDKDKSEQPNKDTSKRMELWQHIERERHKLAVICQNLEYDNGIQEDI